MKKVYSRPTAECSVVQLGHLLTVSGVGDPDRDITYGGVDEEGVKDPASRRQDLWEEEDKEDF